MTRVSFVADQPQLADLRREIDSIDDALHDLLMRRVTLTAGVAASKGATPPIRPAREAAILRRLVARHSGPFPRAVVVRIWREIIAANTLLQGHFAVAVLGSRERDALADLAREYYGQFTPLQLFETPQSVLRAVTDGRATVALLPLPTAEDREPWWRLIARPGAGTPRVIARLPFAQVSPPASEGLAVSLAPNEATGRDHSYMVIETEGELSRSAIARRFESAGLKALEIQTWESGGLRQHLVEVAGFVTAEAPEAAALAAADDIAMAVPIGSYALPLTAAELAAGKGGEKP